MRVQKGENGLGKSCPVDCHFRVVMLLGCALERDVFPAVLVGTVTKQTRNDWESVLIALVWMGL